MRNIILCGFMGCGKSTVGRALAGMTGRQLIDTDAFIEEQAGMTVSAIFDRFGERIAVGGSARPVRRWPVHRIW